MIKKILGIAGPTAVGKTEIAKIISKSIDGQIISADSMQIYKGLDIGTAKASVAEMDGLSQNLIDIIEPNQTFSSFDYGIAASECVENAFSSGRLPIVVGGTGFYFDALLYPLTYADENKNEIRAQLKELKNEKGEEYLYALLEQIDPDSAKSIHPNNVVRVMRALEIFYSTGRKKSEYVLQQNPKYENEIYVLSLPRDILYERINKRVDIMISCGLVNEVENLIKVYGKNCQCFSAIGYKEIIEYFDGKCTLDDAIDAIKQGSRNYAKRQISYFKRFKNAKWIEVDPANPKNTADTILKDFFNE